MLLNGLTKPTMLHNAGSRLPCKLLPAGRMLTVSAAAGASSAQPQPNHHEHADTPTFPFKRPAADQPPAEYAKLRRCGSWCQLDFLGLLAAAAAHQI